MGKCVERVLKKISVGLHSAPPNNTSWYTDSNGFLKHSRSGGSLYYKGPSLQKVIQCFRYPLVYLALKSLQINVINIFIICRSFLLPFCNSSLPPFLPGVLHLGPLFPSLQIRLHLLEIYINRVMQCILLVFGFLFS